MHGHEELGGEAAQVVDDPLHAGGSCGAQMHAADYGMDGAMVGEGLNVFEDMDDAGVGAAEDDDGALGRVEEEGLIIEQWVDVVSFGIEVEHFGKRLLRMEAEDFAGEEEARRDFAGSAGWKKANAGGVQGGEGGGRDADGTGFVKLGLQGIGVNMDCDRGAGGGKRDG